MTNFSAAYGAGGSVVKGVQRGTITIPAPGGNNTATITTVNLSKAMLRFLGFYTNNSDQWGSAVSYQGNVFPNMVFVDASTVKLQRAISSTSYTVTGTFEVLEFN